MSTIASNEPARRRVIGDWMTDEELAGELNVTTRTISNYVAAGMPVIKAGRESYFEPEAVRQWFLSRGQRREPVRRGRPPNKRAA